MNHDRTDDTGRDNSETASRIDQLLTAAMDHHHSGRLHEAEQLYRQILQLVPGHPDALHLLGVLMNQTGEPKLALQFILQAVKRNPEAFNYYSSMGLVLKQLGHLDAAVNSFKQALHMKPDFKEAIYNLGLVFRKQGDTDAAIEQFREVIRLDPSFAEGYNNLAAVFQDRGELEQAIEHYHQALTLQPNYPQACYNLGTALHNLGELNEALPWYDRALALQPGYAEAHFDRGRALLAQGNCREGWQEFEWRFKIKNPIPLLTSPKPRWDGSSLEDKTILVYAEQGLGDELMHASAFSDLVSMAERCIIQCDPRLESLFARSFPNAIVIGASRDDFSWIDKQPPIDVWIAAGSLPLYLRPGIESYPDHQGYLVPDPSLRELYRARLESLGNELKVGICWRGSKRPDSARKASDIWERLQHFTRLEQWKKILAMEGPHFINLQYDNCKEELSSMRAELGITITEWDDTDLFNDLERVAALTSVLDLVITVPTCVFDMAGALGVETWMLYVEPEWIMLGTGRFPCFPSVSVHYRRRTGTWESLLDAIAGQLKERIG